VADRCESRQWAGFPWRWRICSNWVPDEWQTSTPHGSLPIPVPYTLILWHWDSPFPIFGWEGGIFLIFQYDRLRLPPSQLLLLQHSGPLCSISRLALFWGACLLERVSQSRLFGDWNGVLLYDNVILILNIYTGRRVALSHHDVYHTPQWYLFLFILHPVPPERRTANFMLISSLTYPMRLITWPSFLNSRSHSCFISRMLPILKRKLHLPMTLLPLRPLPDPLLHPDTLPPLVLIPFHMLHTELHIIRAQHAFFPFPLCL
jgi:hypothetical protein